MKKTIIVIIVLIVLGVAAFLAWPYLNKQTPVNNDEANAGWLTQTDAEQGVSFQYPAQLSTKYIHTQTWPPTLEVNTGLFTCIDTLRLIDNRQYCVHSTNEGAAGSVYTDYEYTAATDGKLITLKFALRSVQCLNYDQPEQAECLAERESFDLDGVIDRIFRSLEVKS